MSKQGDVSVSSVDIRAVRAALAERHLGFGGSLPSAKWEAEAPCSIGNCSLYGFISIGAYSFVGQKSELRNLTIGRFCSIARRVVIGPVEHPLDGVSTHPVAWGSGNVFRKHAWFASVQAKRRSPWRNGKVEIGNDVWIGNSVTILRGTTIGDGAVIAAGSVVTKDVAPYEVVGGVPARRIRLRFPEDIASRLRATRWWDMDLTQIQVDLSDLKRSLPILEEARAHCIAPLPIEQWEGELDRKTKMFSIRRQETRPT